MLGTVLDISDLLHLPSQTTQSSGAYMNTQPLASESAWFSDAFDYSIAVRRASIGGTGSQAEFTTGEQEFRFTCNFKAPTDAGRAQMTVKTWYSEELAGSI